MASDSPVYYSCDDNDDDDDDSGSFNGATTSDHLEISPCRSSLVDNEEVTSGDVCIQLFNILQEKIVKRSFKHLTRPVVFLATKLMTLASSLPIGSSAVAPVDLVSNMDQILPCLERIKKLEKILEELKKKPSRISAEKEQILEHSMERIKSVELDLDKTKKVLHATMVRQLEISELMERLQQFKFCQRRMC